MAEVAACGEPLPGMSVGRGDLAREMKRSLLGPMVRKCACKMAGTRSDSGGGNGSDETVGDWAQAVEATTLSR
jgi:hypothetical protein